LAACCGLHLVDKPGFQTGGAPTALCPLAEHLLLCHAGAGALLPATIRHPPNKQSLVFPEMPAVTARRPPTRHGRRACGLSPRTASHPEVEDAVGQQRRQGRRRLHAHGDDLSTCAARALSARTPRPWQHAGGQAATPSRADPKLLCCCNRKPAPQCCEARLPARTQARTRRRPRGSTTSVADSACMGRPHASWLHSCVTSLRRQTVSVYSHRRRRSRRLKTSRSSASKLAHQPVPCGAQTGQLWQVLTC